MCSPSSPALGSSNVPGAPKSVAHMPSPGTSFFPLLSSCLQATFNLGYWTLEFFSLPQLPIPDDASLHGWCIFSRTEADSRKSVLSILPLSLCNPVHPLAPSQLSLGVGSSFDWGGFSNLSYLHGRDGLGLVGLQLPSFRGPLSESRCYIMHITCSVPLPFLIQASSFHPFVFVCLYLACCLAVHKWHHCLSLPCFSSYFVEA